MLLKLDVRTLGFQTLQTNHQALYWDVNGLENEFIASFWEQIIEGIQLEQGVYKTSYGASYITPVFIFYLILHEFSINSGTLPTLFHVMRVVVEWLRRRNLDFR